MTQSTHRDKKSSAVERAAMLRYYAKAYCLALSLPMLLGASVFFLPMAQAVNNADVDGENGRLYVHGALTESACRLEMNSIRQDVALGEVGTGRLTSIGAQGGPVRFELRLEDCLRSTAGSRDVRTGGTAWSNNQPAVTVSFKAVRDADNPSLVKAVGVSGLGLRLADGHGRDVRLGDRGTPLLLTPGQDTLIYTVAPERTRAALVPGSYQALVDFYLSYD